jgi:hypothetical protein
MSDNKGQYTSLNPWTPAQEAWLLKGVARGVSMAKLYRQLAGKMPGRPKDIPEWNHPYPTYKSRMKVLTAGNAAAMVKPSKQAKATQKAKVAIDVTAPGGLLERVQLLLDKSDLSTAEEVQVIKLLRELLQESQAGKPRGDDLAEYRRQDIVDLDSPGAVELAADFWVAVRTEYPGGLLAMMAKVFTALSVDEWHAIVMMGNDEIAKHEQAQQQAAIDIADIRRNKGYADGPEDSEDIGVTTVNDQPAVKEERLYHCGSQRHDNESELPKSAFFPHSITIEDKTDPRSWCKLCREWLKRKERQDRE